MTSNPQEPSSNPERKKGPYARPGFRVLRVEHANAELLDEALRTGTDAQVKLEVTKIEQLRPKKSA